MIGLSELRKMNETELERLWERTRDELLLIRRELDRKRGVRNPSVSVDFESYVKE